MTRSGHLIGDTGRDLNAGHPDAAVSVHLWPSRLNTPADQDSEDRGESPPRRSRDQALEVCYAPSGVLRRPVAPQRELRVSVTPWLVIGVSR